MTNWLVRNKESIIRTAFLIPIFSVATISISHVVSWYDIANPINWAIYLSIAVEIAAMSAIAAASVKVKGFSVWFVFAIVTLIQFIGNIFFSYSDIDTSSKSFKDWSELISPILELIGSDTSNLLAQRRWLALLEGGLLPLISLTCLHFFIKYDESDYVEVESKIDTPAQIEVPAQINESEASVEPSIIIPEVQTQVQEENIESSIKKIEDTPLKRTSPDISPKMKKIQSRK